MGRIENKHLIKLLRPFRTIFQHSAHSGISVYVGIFPFDVVFRCILECKVFKDLHQPHVHFPDSGPFRPVQDKFLGRSGMTIFNQDFFHGILYFFYRWRILLFYFRQIQFYLSGQIQGHFPVIAPQDLSSFIDGVCYFIDVE